MKEVGYEVISYHDNKLVATFLIEAEGVACTQKLSRRFIVNELDLSDPQVADGRMLDIFRNAPIARLQDKVFRYVFFDDDEPFCVLRITSPRRICTYCTMNVGFDVEQETLGDVERTLHDFFHPDVM